MRRKNVTSGMMMEYIEQALLLLMERKRYADITIGEITAKAGVNRSTYYRHFSSKESILQAYLDSVMEEYQTRFRARNSGAFGLYLKTMFEVFYQKRETLLMIHRAGLSHLLLPVLMERFHFDRLSEEEQFRVAYHIGGIHSSLLLWFEHGMRETPEEMTRIALQYAPDKARTLFPAEQSVLSD